MTCNLCEAMCGLLATVEDGSVTALRPDPDDVFSRGHICPKALALRELHDDPDRLRRPLRRKANGGFEEIAWDDALDEAARKLSAVQSAHGRDAVGFYSGNPLAHNHGAALGLQLMAFALGTRNRFDSNSQDSNPKVFACMRMYGDGLSLTVPDVDRTSYVLMLGANPAASNGSVMALGDVRGRLQAIRKRGGRIVLLDPRRTETAAWADEHHFLRPGGDSAFLLALLHVLFSSGRIDPGALGVRARGVEALRAQVSAFAPERVSAAIGVEPDLIRRLARELLDAPAGVVYGRMGPCVSEFGPTASWLLEAVNVVTGNFDREGGMMFPRPAVDIGPVARLVIGNGYGRFRSRVRGLPEMLRALPASTMAEEMETPGRGRIRAFVNVAGNPVLSTPDGPRLARALGGLDYVVAVDHYLNETSRLAHLVLPPVPVFERSHYDLILHSVAVRNVAKFAGPVLPRTPGSLDDYEILRGLAARLLAHRTGPLGRSVRSLFEAAVPASADRTIDLFLRVGAYGDRFIPGREGLSLRKLRQSVHGLDLGPLVPMGRQRVRTADGRVDLAPPELVADLPRVILWIDAQRARSNGNGLVLIGRRHLRSNNSWMHNCDSLTRGPDRTALFINTRDARRLGIAAGARVRVKARTGVVEVAAQPTEDIMEGVVSLPHGFGHAGCDTLRVASKSAPGVNINALTDADRVEPIIGTSILNGVPVEVEALPETGRG
jgi:anaerobic selenocysteine-containing dehydrogenase